jgi:thiol-disulfide isomerase/thioredoxin
MKNISFLLIPVIILNCSCKMTKPAAEVSPQMNKTTVPAQTVPGPEFSFSDPSTFILGYFKIDRLTQAPYSTWYLKGYDEYSINSDAINKLMDTGKDNLSIKIVMGTWCSDSRREVPRLMRILDIWRFPISQVTFIGVDKAKKAPVKEIESLDIQKVPTFIIFKNNIEAGRIIETPVTSLEQDMVNILTRKE